MHYLQRFVENAREPGMMTDSPIELELRNLQESSRGWNVALSDMNSSGALVRIERECGWPLVPRIKRKWNELLVVVCWRMCGRD